MPSAGRKRKEPSSPTDTNSNTTKDAKLASGLYRESGDQLKKLCSVEGCGSFAQQGGDCTAYGARTTCYCWYHHHLLHQDAKLASGLYKEVSGCLVNRLVKLCSYEGCEKQARNSGVCIKHGAKKTTCSYEGCTNQVVNSGVCIKHGAIKQVK